MPVIIFMNAAQARLVARGRLLPEARGAYQGAVLAGNSKSRYPVRGNGFVFNSMKKTIYLRRRRAARPARASRESVAVVGSGIGAVTKPLTNCAS